MELRSKASKFCGVLVGIIMLCAFTLGDGFAMSMAVVCCLAYFVVFGF